ncbi:MAG TPA: nucleotide sugar dehydrogenase, partial [Pseudidiomarina sp.]|nr:nucleotide sugar dehydrogenase [Pseudidiomarina sp.]
MKIAVAGTGYVGLSNAVLLAQHNHVTLVDIVPERVAMVNAGKSPIQDADIEHYLTHQSLQLTATTDHVAGYQQADWIIVATPTDYNPDTNTFDTSSVEAVIEAVLKVNRKAPIVIKSTIPVGYVERARQQFATQQIMFSPEFLREGKALHDNLYPSRIIVGEQSERAEMFAKLLLQGALKTDVTVQYTDPTEAEAIKLFANTYLAMRVAYFNEL